MRSFNSKDFTSHFTQRPRPGAHLRPAVITSIDPAKGTVNIEWLDYPGIRQNILITPNGQGIFELPTVGSTVLVGFDMAFNAYVLAYIPVGYRDLVGTPRIDNSEVTSSILKLGVGEKMLISYLAKSEENKNNQFAKPLPTGTYFYMSNVGDILMKTAEGDYWRLDRRSNIIQQNSMNYRAITEAGILDFGLVKRASTDPEKQTENIISATGVPLGGNTAGQNADFEEILTEFRLRILETADAESTTAPEVDNPLVELTLGTKVTDEGQIELTNKTHAMTSDNFPKEIMIQIKTKVDQGFEFTVDKEGNLTVKVNGNVRLDTTGNSDITVGGDATITVAKDTQVNAENIVLNANDIKVAGNSKEQPVVLKEFLTKYYNMHQHIGNNGAPTGTPMIKSPLSKGKDISDITEVG